MGTCFACQMKVWKIWRKWLLLTNCLINWSIPQCTVPLFSLALILSPSWSQKHIEYTLNPASVHTCAFFINWPNPASKSDCFKCKSTLRAFHTSWNMGEREEATSGYGALAFRQSSVLESTGVESATHPVLPVELHSISVVASLTVSGWCGDKWPVFLFSRRPSCAHNKPLLQTLTLWTLGWETVHDREHRPIPHNPLHSHLHLTVSDSVTFITAFIFQLLLSMCKWDIPSV